MEKKVYNENEKGASEYLSILRAESDCKKICSQRRYWMKLVRLFSKTSQEEFNMGCVAEQKNHAGYRKETSNNK